MKLAVDASNLSSGGGVTHLVELLEAAEPREWGVHEVLVWAPEGTLSRLPSRPWLVDRHHPALEGGALRRILWQRSLGRRLGPMGVDLLFVPGSLYLGGFRPYVTMSQNLLPFTPEERRRFGVSGTRLRYHLLALGQGRTFRRAAGVVFLTETARERVTGRTGELPGRVAVVPHGIPDRFFREVPEQESIDEYGPDRAFEWLYVSPVAPYKHPWNVARAAVRLRRRGVPVRVTFVGPARGPARLGRKRLENTLRELDPRREVLDWVGPVPYRDLHHRYRQARAFVFASTCENLPITLLEAMASGLPVASSDRLPMPRVLGEDGAVFFDPESVESIEEAMLELTRSPERRRQVAERARERVGGYSWERCARETFRFLTDVARRSAGKG